MRSLVTLLATATAAVSPVFAQSQLCQQFDSQIRLAEQNIASEFAEGIGDNSAPRATNRELRVNTYWTQIHVNLVQAQSNRCPPITRVISGSHYLSAALTCATDRMRSGGTTPDSCKRSNWKPEPIAD